MAGQLAKILPAEEEELEETSVEAEAIES